MINQTSLLRRGLTAGLIGALGLLLSACSSPATVPTVTQTSSPAATTTSEAAASETATSAAPDATEHAQFGPTAVCADLRDALVRQLALDVTLREGPVQDPQTGTSSAGCQLSASGSAAELGRFLDVAAKLRTLLTSQGWSEDQRYLADGPTGTASGYRKNDILALTQVEWQPTPDASCPADQPVSGCELTPQQQLLNITLNLTRQ